MLVSKCFWCCTSLQNMFTYIDACIYACTHAYVYITMIVYMHMHTYAHTYISVLSSDFKTYSKVEIQKW